MRRPLIFLSDPGIANLGWAVAAVDLKRNRITMEPEGDERLESGVIRTEPEANRRGERKVVDHLRRVMEISEQIGPHIARADAAAIEAMSFGYKNAQTMAIMCLVYGCIATHAQQARLPVVQIHPQTVKKALMNRRDATKIEVQAAVHVKVPGARAHTAAVNDGVVEHLADAFGVGVACLVDPIIMATLASFRRQQT